MSFSDSASLLQTTWLLSCQQDSQPLGQYARKSVVHLWFPGQQKAEFQCLIFLTFSITTKVNQLYRPFWKMILF